MPKEQKKMVYFLISMMCISALTGTCGCSESISETLDKKTPDPDNDAIVVIDNTGTIYHSTQPATRIVTQNSDAVELLIAFGAQERIVGVAEYIKKHEILGKYVADIDSIGDSDKPNIESILILKPDAFVIKGSKMTITDQLRAINVSLIWLDCYRVPHLASDARALGNLTGTSCRAEEYAQYVEKYLDLIDLRVKNNVQNGSLKAYSESYADYTAQGTESGGTQILTMLNAKNIGEEIQGQAVIVSPEWVVERNPDVIVKIVSQSTLQTESLDQVRERIMKRPGFEQINAVKTGRVYVINGDLLYSPRGAAGMVYLAKAFYPELFSDINPDDVLEEYCTRFFADARDIPTISPHFMNTIIKQAKI